MKNETPTEAIVRGINEMKSSTQPEMKIHKCSLCEGDIEQKKVPETGVVYWSSGNNAAPLNEGRCCDTCNREKVIPARMRDISDYGSFSAHVS